MTRSPDGRPVPPITCPHYESIPGSRRCRSYDPSGACLRPDTFMCLEWLKVNPGPSLSPTPPVPPPQLPRPSTPRLFALEPTEPSRPLAAAARPSTPAAAPLPLAFGEADVASFRARGQAVCLRSEGVGELWLVPEYTASDRRELSLQHAALLATLCAAFPGARVVAFEPAAPPCRGREHPAEERSP